MCAQKAIASRQPAVVAESAPGKRGLEHSTLPKPEVSSWRAAQEYARPLYSSGTPAGDAKGPSHPFLPTQQYLGNQAVLRRLQSGLAPAVIAAHPQSRFGVNTPDDPSEQEADRVAEQVVGMRPVGQSPIEISSAARGVQRQCACGGTCDQCKEEHAHFVFLQKKSSSAKATPATSAAHMVHSVLQAPGQPLDAATRAYMEPRFGRDFSGVRVHTDQEAAASADTLAADAYTFGQHIVFREGAFSPDSTEGRRLIAHELAHTVQQSGGPPSAKNPSAIPSVSKPGDPLEFEADLAAGHVVRGGSPRLAVRGNGPVATLQRKPQDKPKKAPGRLNFTMKPDHGIPRSYYIFFPDYVEPAEALRAMFVNGTVPKDIEVEYEGVMIQGWAFRFRYNTTTITQATFLEFTPALQSHFHPDHLALTEDETQAFHERQEAVLNSSPVFLGGQTVRDALSIEHCKDHLVPGELGSSCWGERAGYFYWVGFDSREGGTTFEAKSSPRTPNVRKDWEWFLSHSPADYVPHARDLPYASTFDPSSKANFSLNQTEQLENELKDWEFRQEISAYATVFASVPGAVRNPTIPPPSTYGQLLKTGSTAIQAYEAWKVALGGEQNQIDLYLTGLAGLLDHGAGFLGNGAGRPTQRNGTDDAPSQRAKATRTTTPANADEERNVLPGTRAKTTSADDASTSQNKSRPRAAQKDAAMEQAVHESAQKTGAEVTLDGEKHGISAYGTGKDAEFLFCSDPYCSIVLKKIGAILADLPEGYNPDMQKRLRRLHVKIADADRRLKAGSLGTAEANRISHQISKEMEGYAQRDRKIGKLLQRTEEDLSAHRAEIKKDLEGNDLRQPAEKPRTGPGTRGSQGTRLERTYRISPGDALAASLQGYQVYEYRNAKGELLYVGKSGGEAGETPMNWPDRLKNQHIKTEWIGEAKTVTVTSDLSFQESFALEEVLIPTAKYNKASGEYSKRFPHGNLAGDAKAASAHGSRHKFKLDVMF